MLWVPDEGDPQVGRVFRASDAWPLLGVEEGRIQSWVGIVHIGTIYVYLGRSHKHATVLLPNGIVGSIWYSAVYEDDEI